MPEGRMDLASVSPYRLVAYQFGHRAMIATLATVGVALGVAMIVGGPERFSSPGFRTARVVPGGVYTWGGMLTAAGLLTAAGIIRHWSRRIVMAGMACEGCWFAFFAVSLGVATFSDPHVAVTGPIVYSGVAVLCAIGYDTGSELRRPRSSP